jgi:transposase-like protein
LLEFFVAGITARMAAEIVGVHRNSATRATLEVKEKVRGGVEPLAK